MNEEFIAPNLSELSKRFLEAMTKLSLTGYKLVKDGVLPGASTLTQIKNSTQNPSRKTITAFCTLYGISDVWLLTGKGEMMDANATPPARIDREPSEVSKRFLKFTDSLSLTGYRLNKDGILPSKTTIIQIRKGLQEPSIKAIDALCAKYPVSKAWIYTGEGEMRTDGVADPKPDGQPESNISKARGISPNDLVEVPFVPVSAAASFVESFYEGQDDKPSAEDTYMVVPEEGEQIDSTYMVFQVDGHSMEPTIPDRAKILAKRIPEGQWEYITGVVVIVFGKTVTVKRIQRNDLFTRNALTIEADNRQFGTMTVQRSEIRGIWKALRIVSQRII